MKREIQRLCTATQTILSREPKAAREILLATRELDLTAPQPLNLLAIAEKNLGHHARAIAWYEELAELTPEDEPRVLSLIGRCRASMGQLDDAIIAYQKSLALKPSALTFHQLGMAQYYAGQTTDALDSIRQSHDMQPTELTSLVDVAALHRILGQQAEFDAALAEAKAFPHPGFEEYGRACFFALEDKLSRVLTELAAWFPTFPDDVAKADKEPAFHFIKDTPEFRALLTEHRPAAPDA